MRSSQVFATICSVRGRSAAPDGAGIRWRLRRPARGSSYRILRAGESNVTYRLQGALVELVSTVINATVNGNSGTGTEAETLNVVRPGTGTQTVLGTLVLDSRFTITR